MNRCNVGLCDIPFLFPDYGMLPAEGYQRQLLSAMDVPYLVNDTLMLMPQYAWGNRIANAPPNLGYPTFTNINRTNDVSISVTKVKSSHTIKGGFFSTHSFKAQNLGVAAGANAFQGSLNFANDTNNPLDAGFGFANAALGIFSSYGQQSKIVDGVFIYTNLEGYIQDNWKVNGRLTARLRPSHHASAAAVRQAAASLEFLRRSVVARERAALVCGRLSRKRQSVRSRQPAGAQSGHGRVARARQRAGDRDAGAGGRQPHQRTHQSMVTASRRKTTSGRPSCLARDSGRPTT